jgi:hypothetical protein
MPAYEVKVDELQLEQAKRVFSNMPDLQHKVHRQALNKTMTGVRTDMARAAQKEFTAQYGRILDSVSIKKATINDSSAYVKSTGKPLPLGYFSTSRTKEGVKVQVMKNKPATLIRHAFIRTTRSGHKGVFWRVWKGARKPVNKRIAYGALPKQYRLPMKERFGPSTPDVLKHMGVLPAVLSQADDRLHTAYQQVIDNEMRKL